MSLSGASGGPHPTANGDRAQAPAALALVVDDEPRVREMLAGLLESAGFRSIRACSAEEASALLDDHEPRIGVFDIAMPGMSGAELAWRIKQRRPDLPLVAVTGHLGVWDPDDLADLVAAACVAKPAPGIIEPGAAETVTAWLPVSSREIADVLRGTLKLGLAGEPSPAHDAATACAAGRTTTG